MNFWKMVFDLKCFDADFIRQAVKTEKNPFGDITPEEFKGITGEDFVKEDDHKEVHASQTEGKNETIINDPTQVVSKIERATM